MSSETSLIARGFVWLVERVQAAPIRVLTVSLVLAAVSAVAFCTCLEYRTQRSDLVSPDKDYQQRWKRYLAEFGDEDDLVLVVKGKDRKAMTDVIDRASAWALAHPNLYDRVFHRVDLRPLQDRSLLFLPVDDIKSIQSNVRRMGPLLLGPTGPLAWKSLTLFNLLRQARERTGKIDPDAPLDPADEQYLGQLLALVRSACASLNDPEQYRNPWGSLIATPPGPTNQMAEPQYFFSGDGSLAFMLVHPVKEAESFTPASESVRTMRIWLDELRSQCPQLELGLTGLPVLETDEMEASQRDTTLAGWLAFGGVAVLYVVFYRCFRLPFLTVAALMVGTGWAMGWLTLTVGHLNILSSTFAVMLIGIGDYGVLWMTHYEEERRLGADLIEAQKSAAAHVGPSVLTAAVGTALAFFAAMLADFQGVVELGWIAGCGVFFCGLSTFTVLPALQLLIDRKRKIEVGLAVVNADGERRLATPPPESTGEFLPMLARRPGWVLAASALLVLFLTGFSVRVGYDHNLLNLQAHGLDSVHWEKVLIEQCAGASWHAQSFTSSPQEALALKAQYERCPEVSRVAEVASLMPAEQERKIELLADIQKWLANLPAKATVFEPFTSRPRDLRKESTLLIGALQPLAPVSPHQVLEQLIRSLVELRDHPAFKNEEVAFVRLRSFEQRLATDLLDDLHRLREVSHAAPITLNDLPGPLRERFVGASGKWLVQAFAKENLWDIQPLERFVAATRAVDTEATGKPFGTLEGLRAMQRGFTWAGVYALLVIIVVLWLDFVTVRHTLLALLPLLIGALMVLGVMGMIGMQLNPANMIALPLIVGVGVDNGVHVLHDFRGRTRGRAYSLKRTTGNGIAISAITTALGFGTLMISTHVGLVSLGFVLAFGVTCCMVVALVLLPATLRVLERYRDSARVQRPLKTVTPVVRRRVA